MKRLLLATTALTAVGLFVGADYAAAQSAPMNQTDSRAQRDSEAAETAPVPPPETGYVSPAAKRIELKLSGYFQQWGVWTNQEYKTRPGGVGTPSRHQSTNQVSQKHNSEICFIGQTTLDNGLTIGVNVQMEANTSSDQIDESYLFLQSPSMGRIEVGDTNNAGYKLHVTAPDGGISLDSGDLCNITAFETGNQGNNSGLGASLFDTPLCTTNLRLNDNDSGKFTYFTPRYAGFQAGISYIPEFAAGGGDNNSALKLAGTGNLGRASGQNNGVSPGLNYTDKFGDFGVMASLGYLYAQASQSDFPNQTTGNVKNLVAYNGGAQFSYAGFSFGGAYIYVPQGTRTITGAATTANPAGTNVRFNGESWTAGAAYSFGPYKIGLDYLNGRNNKTTSGGQDRLEQATVSGTWTMGPGIRLVGGVFYYDWQEENQLSENNGIGVTTAMKIGF